MLVTGDSVGQVASQTIENIDVISRAVPMPILRPLIGDDKVEIVDVARRIGTYEISIQPDQDCCSLFVPKHPETKANLGADRRIRSAIGCGGRHEGGPGVRGGSATIPRLWHSGNRDGSSALKASKAAERPHRSRLLSEYLTKHASAPTRHSRAGRNGRRRRHSQDPAAFGNDSSDRRFGTAALLRVAQPEHCRERSSRPWSAARW